MAKITTTINPTIDYAIVENFIKNVHGGSLFRIGAYSTKALTKEHKGEKLVKAYELTGRVGCKYGNVVKDWTPTESGKPKNYIMRIEKRIKEFLTTKTRQIMFYPGAKANARATYFLIDKDGEVRELTANAYESLGGIIGGAPKMLNINADNVYHIKFGKFEM